LELNSDFSKRVLVNSDQEPWQASPMPGVDRRMLDRIGGEVARATTIVRYAPNSKFSGVFQDEHGDFPAGTYVRNPPTTEHTPGSDEGCTIFVKLWQFDMDDRNQFRKEMASLVGPEADGLKVAELHQDGRETVTYTEAAAGSQISDNSDGGIELLVLSGTLTEGGETMPKGSWLRLPEGQGLSAKAGEDGAKVWMKTGHLPFAQAPQA